MSKSAFLDQLEQNILDILANIAGFRHAVASAMANGTSQDARQGLGHQGLAAAGQFRSGDVAWSAQPLLASLAPCPFLARLNLWAGSRRKTRFRLYTATAGLLSPCLPIMYCRALLDSGRGHQSGSPLAASPDSAHSGVWRCLAQGDAFVADNTPVGDQALDLAFVCRQNA